MRQGPYLNVTLCTGVRTKDNNNKKEMAKRHLFTNHGGQAFSSEMSPTAGDI